MTITVEATYENGQLRLDEPLAVAEGTKVRVTLCTMDLPAPPELDQPSLAERIVARARALPPEVFDAWPADGASQHDHYIYGTPKRPE
ncbi:MAG: antitoxin family protein [Planctomycetaceae bacterium]